MMERAPVRRCVDEAAAVASTYVNSQCDESRREAFAAMVQTGELGGRMDFASRGYGDSRIESFGPR